MAVFCIPRHLVERLKESAIKGEIDIRKLYDMDSTQRRTFFEKFTDKDLGKLLNTEFEKAMVSKQKTALKDWAESVFKPSERKNPAYKNVLDKISSLDELGVLNPKTEKAFMRDLVSDRLGITVTPEEVRIIAEKAKVIEAAHDKVGTDIGNPEKLAENLEFFEVKKSMDDYLLSLTPASKLKVVTGTIGRAAMLASVKSPVLNIGSNAEVGLTEAFGRRIASGQFRGTDGRLAVDYWKMAQKIYQKTGYDISRMMSINDGGASGSRTLGDTVHAGGPGAVRRVGQIAEDVVFKQMMGAPDVAFSAAHFADSVSLQSMRYAEGDKVAAREIMLDSMRLEPQTPRGELVKAQGVLDAQVATWTNKTWGSIVSEGIRNILNNVSGDLRIGDYVMPFVKTPANVISTGADYAGAGFVKAAYDTAKAFKTGDLRSPEYTQALARNLVRSGIGLTGAVIIASQLNKDDFVGAYDPARKQIEELRNSNTNSIRVGGKWISTDWLGPLAIPVTAIMYARKYGNTPGSMALQYGYGVESGIENLPGLSLAAGAARSGFSQKDETAADVGSAALNYAGSEAFSRLVPSLVGDVAKATDSKVRVNQQGIQGLKSKVPGLRETVPVKTNIFGEDVETEPAWTSIIFGSRVRTDKETPLVTELSTLSDATGKGIAFTDWSQTTSKAVAQFKEKLGPDKFNDAKKKYGAFLKSALEKEIASKKYQAMSDEEKLKAINSLDADVQDQVFKQYNFKPTKAKVAK